MATLSEREKAFEAKFRQDEELRFKVTARRNRLLGEWAAGLMGIGGEDAAAYAREVVKSDFEKPGDEDVLEKVLGDLTARGVETSAHLVRKQMDELMPTAMAQIQDEAAGDG